MTVSSMMYREEQEGLLRMYLHNLKREEIARKVTKPNELLSNVTGKIWEQLDFGPRDVELAKLERGWELELQAEINSILDAHITAAFVQGWECSKNPGAWLFGPNGLNQESPQNIFNATMAAMGFGDEDVLKHDGELGTVIADLFSRAEALAFKTGWNSQRDPEKLIFAPEE